MHIRNIWDNFLAYKPTGMIPRFPVWETVVTFFTIFYGFVGLLRPDSSNMVILLQGKGDLWSGALMLSGIMAAIGMCMRIPDGLILHLAGMIILTVGSISVLVGLIVLQGNLVFAGSTSLYTFGLGGLLRSIQIIFQLRKLREAGNGSK